MALDFCLIDIIEGRVASDEAGYVDSGCLSFSGSDVCSLVVFLDRGTEAEGRGGGGWGRVEDEGLRHVTTSSDSRLLYPLWENGEMGWTLDR